jgi:GNAT superfamily N-acetyltransferase
MKIQIRNATESDIPMLLSLIKDLAQYEKLLPEVVTGEQELRESLFSKRPAAEALIGEGHGRPIGFAIFFHNFSTFLGKRGLYLEDLFIKPEFRKQGFGEEMLIRLAQIATERNCGRFEWAVLDWNESAIGFYKKLGARQMDDWRVFRLTGEALRNLANRN